MTLKRCLPFLILVFALIACVAVFVGCNEKDNNCVVTFVVSGGSQDARYEKTVTPGTLVKMSDFNDLIGDDFAVGKGIFTGFFRDSNCVFKFDDSEPICNDTTLYVKHSNAGTPVLNFVLDGNTYPLAVDRTDTVNVYDFILSAYGKSAYAEQFDFFKDEQCTEALNLTDYNYKSCEFDFWYNCKIYVKKHDVAIVNFCTHNNSSECTTSFSARIRTDKTLDADMFAKFYSAYTGDTSFTATNATFYSDASLKNEIHTAGKCTTVHVNVPSANA